MLRLSLLAVLCTTGAAAADEMPAARYGKLTQNACEAELIARDVPFVREQAPGVLAPVRLTGPLRGVTFRTNEREAARTTSVWEIADCRLVLALDDFARILAAHDIVEVRHYSMYRRTPKHWPDGRIGARHHGGLALDAARFVRADGSRLDVLDHFKGRRRTKVCGKHAPGGKTAEARELREIVCAAVGQGLFNVVLTPNFNRAHRNHFHLEVTAGVTWLMVR